MNFLFMKPTSVDTVLAVFTKAIADLKSVQEHNETEAVKHREEARKAQEAEVVASKEAVRAVTVRQKLEAIVNV